MILYIFIKLEGKENTIKRYLRQNSINIEIFMYLILQQTHI